MFFPPHFQHREVCSRRDYYKKCFGMRHDFEWKPIIPWLRIFHKIFKSYESSTYECKFSWRTLWGKLARLRTYPKTKLSPILKVLICMVTSYKRISMSSRATNIIKQSKSIVLFNGTYWCTPKLYARGVARGKSAHVTRKIEEKLKFQVLWKYNEYEYFVPFFVNHNRSQWKSTLHTFNSFECFIIFVRAFWHTHIFLAAGHFEQNQQKLCKNQSNDVHISNIWTKYFIYILSMLKFVIVCLFS